MGKFIVVILLFGMFIFIFHSLSGGEETASEQSPRVLTIKRDRQLETGIDQSYAANSGQTNDWGATN